MGVINLNITSSHHRFDLGFIVLLVIRVISDYLLIPLHYQSYLDHKKVERIGKGIIKSLKVIAYFAVDDGCDLMIV